MLWKQSSEKRYNQTMKIYNTMSRKKEELIPLTPGEFKIYACGPTVYNYIHIGNARPLCVFDVLRRYLEYRGNKVTFVQNFTDIDDKLINRANEEEISVAEVAERYIKEYWIDAEGLNIRKADFHPRATENIDAILGLIDILTEKGYAYASDDGVYFSTKTDPEYGKLSHQPLEELEAGARIDVSEHKKDPMDFCLWKNAKPGEPFWDSKYGKGRPGWHIECSAMAGRYLGKTIDIHCGGKDLIFPHHENEIAQSECANGCTFSRYWMHNGYINADHKKMSKSLNNFFTVREIAEKHGYEPIRYLMLSAHYRSPVNYDENAIVQSKNALARLYRCRELLSDYIDNSTGGGDEPGFLDQYRNDFIKAMDDDLNTADALGALFNLVKECNTFISSRPGRNAAMKCLSAFKEMCGVLGLCEKSENRSVDATVERLIAERTAARQRKDYKTADELRDKLSQMGIELKDTPEGVKWNRKNLPED